MFSHTYIYAAYYGKEVQSKQGNIFSQETIHLGVFCDIFLAYLER